MATISSRLRELKMYAGLVFDDQNGDELMALLDHRERRTRGEIGTNYLKKAPKLAKGPTPNTFELNVDEFSGVSNRRPVFQDSAVDISLEEAGDGTIQGNTVVTTGPGYSRFIVVTAEWVAIPYDQRTDDNGATVYLHCDEGVYYRVFMGAEALSPSLPTADLEAALAATGALPVAVVKRDFSDIEINPDNIFGIETLVAHVKDTVTAIKAAASSMLSNFPSAWIRRIPATPVADEDDLRKILMTPSAVTNGGKVTLDAGADLYVIGIDGELRWIVPDDDPFETDDLDVSSTYLLRCQLDQYRKLTFYVQKGTIPIADGNTYEAIPASLKGTPDAASGGAFPSTSRDLLLGIIETGLAGTVPTWTPLYSGDFTFEFQVGYNTTPLIVPMTVTKPFSSDYDIRIEFSEANFSPTPPAANHRDFKPLGSRITYYSWRSIEIEARGRWLEDNGAGLLRIPAANEIARPGYRVIVRPKYRTVA